jgi:putative hemolysin
MVNLHAGAIASRALDFGDLTATDVMVHRNRAVMLSLAMSESEVRRIVLDSRMTRLPVHEGQPDATLGYVLAHDVLGALVEGRRIDLRRYLRPPLFVPWAMRAGDVLVEMQQRKSQLAIVVDEHGGMAGLVTVEDLVEELVGKIASEHEQEPAALLREADGVALALAGLPIRDLNRALDVDLPAGDGATTVGGLVSGLHGGIPVRGERVTEPGSGVAFEVVAATRQAVGVVRVVVPEREFNEAVAPEPAASPERV